MPGSIVEVSRFVCTYRSLKSNVHANGQTRFTVLAPVLKELEEKGCRERPEPRKADPYIGILRPDSFVW